MTFLSDASIGSEFFSPLIFLDAPVDVRSSKIERLRLYHVTKFSPYFPFTLYCFYTKISSFMPVLTIRIVLDCFYLLIFYSEKFST